MNTQFSLADLQKSIVLLSASIRKQDFLTYFKQFSLISSTEDAAILGVVSSFHKDNLTKKFARDIEKSIQEINPNIKNIEIAVDESIEVKKEDEIVDCRAILKSTEKKTKKEQSQ